MRGLDHRGRVPVTGARSLLARPLREMEQYILPYLVAEHDWIGGARMSMGA